MEYAIQKLQANKLFYNLIEKVIDLWNIFTQLHINCALLVYKNCHFNSWH